MATRIKASDVLIEGQKTSPHIEGIAEKFIKGISNAVNKELYLTEVRKELKDSPVLLARVAAWFLKNKPEVLEEFLDIMSHM